MADTDLDARFTAAVAASTTLPKRPDNATLLSLYAHYKQSTVGDASGKRPGFTDMMGRAKFDAWSKLVGTSSDDAKTAYSELVENLAG